MIEPFAAIVGGASVGVILAYVWGAVSRYWSARRRQREYERACQEWAVYKAEIRAIGLIDDDRWVFTTGPEEGMPVDIVLRERGIREVAYPRL